MKNHSLVRYALSSVLLAGFSVMISIAHAEDPQAEPKKTDGANPLLQESTLQYHYPLFDQIKNEHFQPAVEAGMAAELKEIEAIANNKEKPTFENTIVEMEKGGELLSRSYRIFVESEWSEYESDFAEDRQRAVAETLRASGRDSLEQRALPAGGDAL